MRIDIAYVAASVLMHLVPSGGHPQRVLQSLEPEIPWYFAEGFMLQAIVRGLCIHDGGALPPSSSVRFQLQPCGDEVVNQVFRYDTETSQIRSFFKNGWCLDDGEGALRWQSCSASSPNQTFAYDMYSGHLWNPSRPVPRCLSDGGGWRPGDTDLAFADCDDEDWSQYFFAIPETDPVAPPSASPSPSPSPSASLTLMSTLTPTLPPSPPPGLPSTFVNGDAFKILSTRKNCDCISATSTSTSELDMSSCDTATTWIYDLPTAQIRDQANVTRCIDDGGSSDVGAIGLRLGPCQAGNVNQQFQLNTHTNLLFNPNKANLCVMDNDVHTTATGPPPLALSACDPSDWRQLFTVRAP